MSHRHSGAVFALLKEHHTALIAAVIPKARVLTAELIDLSLGPRGAAATGGADYRCV